MAKEKTETSEQESKDAWRSKVRDWIVIVLSLVSIASTIGSWKVWTYRIEQMEQNQKQDREHLNKMDTSIQQLSGTATVVVSQSELLKAHTEALSSLQVFKTTQEILDRDIRDHMKDSTIHVTSERQQVMVMQALQPLSEQLTKLSVQMEDRQKQWDRIEKALGAAPKSDK